MCYIDLYRTLLVFCFLKFAFLNFELRIAGYKRYEQIVEKMMAHGYVEKYIAKEKDADGIWKHEPETDESTGD